MKEIDLDNNIEEHGINLQNEGKLHLGIKRWYYRPGDRIESKVDNYIIDIVRGDQLIEIQTKNFYMIKTKLKKLLENHRLLLVHPIIVEKKIIKLSEDHSIISSKKSPAKGSIIDIFDELMRAPDLILHDNFSLEVLLVKVDEIRCVDGKGSWRRKGVSILERHLTEVVDSISFKNVSDLCKLLPSNMTKPFTNKLLATEMNIKVNKARKITYCLRNMGILNIFDKQGQELLYTFTDVNAKG